MTRPGPRRSAFGPVGAHLVLQSLVVLVLAVAWFRASSEPLARDQGRWLDLAVGALLLSGALNGLFLMGASRAVAVRRATLYRTARRATPLPPHPRRIDGPQRAPKFAAGPAMTRYHRPTCALAVGKPVRLDLRRDHEAAGRRPCGICQP